MGKMIKFAHVNEHGDFEKVLSHFNIEYTKSGDQLRCCCPCSEHDDTNPSCSITLVAIDEGEKQVQANTWHCFGCNNKGTLIDFVGHVMPEPDDDDQYFEAEDGEFGIRRAAIKIDQICGCGLVPPKRGRKRAVNGSKPATPKKTKPAKSAGEAPGAAKAKSKGKKAKKKRKAAKAASAAAAEPVSVNQPISFSLTVDHEHPYVLERISAAQAQEFGVGVVAETSRSMMAGRCCVPLHNLAGEKIGYAGRYLGDDPDEPKWKLPPKFDKMKMLFNAHRVVGAQHVVIVEGCFDAIRLHGLTIPAVAVIGTAVSEEQVLLLSEIGVRRVTVLFDGDDEGQAAAERSLPLLARSFFVRLGSLPVGFDPADVETSVLTEQVGAVW